MENFHRQMVLCFATDTYTIIVGLPPLLLVVGQAVFHSTSTWTSRTLSSVRRSSKSCASGLSAADRANRAPPRVDGATRPAEDRRMDPLVEDRRQLGPIRSAPSRIFSVRARCLKMDRIRPEAEHLRAATKPIKRHLQDCRPPRSLLVTNSMALK